MKGRSEIEIVCRDRSHEYKQVISHSLPHATQIADRWYILKNLRQSLYRVINRHYPLLLKKAKASSTFGPQFNLDPTSSKLKLRQHRSHTEQAASQASLARRQACYEQVKEAAQAGYGQRRIARELGLNRETVRQYLAADAPPPRASRSSLKPSILAPYYAYLEQRWQAGYHKAVSLARTSVTRLYR